MPLNRNTLIRIKTIDACLRRRQRQWTIEDLRQACEDALIEYEGIDSVSLRTVQRDIELMRSDKLGYNAPIIVKQRKYYMYENPDYSITQLPLSEHDIAELSSAVEILHHYNSFRGMVGSDDILTRLQDRIGQQGNHEQVVFIDTNTQLKGLHFLSKLYNNIVKHQMIRVEYQSFKSRHPGTFLISPYYVKEFNNRWFVLGYCTKMNDVVTLALDRMLSVEADDASTFIPNTFIKPEEYFGQMVGVTRNLSDPPVPVTLRIDADQAPYVLTKPLHQSQQFIERKDDGSIIVSLQVVLNQELTRLLLGFGEHLEVVAPLKLRQSMARKVHILAAKYQRRYMPCSDLKDKEEED